MTNRHLSLNFTEAEFACSCCGKLPADGMEPSLIVLLEGVRTHFGSVPVMVNSGYRCPSHNAAVGGAPDSEHINGTAADIVVSGVPASDVFAYLDAWHDGGLGEYSTFTHVDMRPDNARWCG